MFQLLHKKCLHVTDVTTRLSATLPIIIMVCNTSRVLWTDQRCTHSSKGHGVHSPGTEIPRHFVALLSTLELPTSYTLCYYTVALKVNNKQFSLTIFPQHFQWISVSFLTLPGQLLNSLTRDIYRFFQTTGHYAAVIHIQSIVTAIKFHWIKISNYISYSATSHTARPSLYYWTKHKTRHPRMHLNLIESSLDASVLTNNHTICQVHRFKLHSKHHSHLNYRANDGEEDLLTCLQQYSWIVE